MRAMSALSRSPLRLAAGLLLGVVVVVACGSASTATKSNDAGIACAEVDASLAEIRTVVADLSSLITHASIAPVQGSSSGSGEGDAESDPGQEMEEYSVQLRVRLPRAATGAKNAAQGKEQQGHIHDHARNQTSTSSASFNPSPKATEFLRQLITSASGDAAGKVDVVHELLGSLLRPLKRSLEPICAQRQEDQRKDVGGEYTLGLSVVDDAIDGDANAQNVIHSNTGQLQIGQRESVPQAMLAGTSPPPTPDFPAFAYDLYRPYLSPPVRRQRREDAAENRISYECPLTNLLLQAAKHKGDPNIATIVFADACRTVSETDPIFVGNPDNAVFLSIVVDYSEQVSIDSGTLSAVEAFLKEMYFSDIHLSIAVRDWEVILRQLLQVIRWPSERILSLHVTSRLRVDEVSTGSLPVDAFRWFGNVSDLRLSLPGLVTLPNGIFEKTPKLRRLQILDTQITTLRAGLFTGISGLVHLRLINNPITTVQQGLFSSFTNLVILFLARTELEYLPTHVVQSLPVVHFLFLSDNKFESLPSSFFMDMSRLRILDLSNNKLTTLPDRFPDTNSTLKLVNLQENHLRYLSDTFFLRERAIDSLLLANNPSLFLHAQHLDRLEQPRILHLANVTLIGDVEGVFSSKAGLWNLTTLTIGWEGLNEDVLSISTICNLLADATNLLSITFSSYDTFEVCQGTRIQDLVLSNNHWLRNVTVGDHNRLDLSDSSSLTSLRSTGGRIPTVDVSRTNIAYSQLFCRELGSSQFIARRMWNLQNLEPELLLRQCFEEGQFFDFSENSHPFFGNPELLSTTIPQRIVFGENPQHFYQSFEDNGGEPEFFRTSVPTFLLDSENINCQVDFEPAELFTLNFWPIVAGTDPVLTMSTTCNCARGFRVGIFGLCEPIPSRLPIVAIIVSVAVSAILIAIPVLIYRRNRRKREKDLLLENELQERLLLKSNLEVEALKQGWQISLDEIHLITKVDEGAFGAVWKGDWEGVAVAVKFLKLASFGMVDSYMLQDIEKEVDFLQRTRHTNLVRFFGTGKDRHDAPFLVLEFVDLGSLKHLLHERGLESAIAQATEASRSRLHSSSSATDEDFVFISSPTASPSSTFSQRVKSAASLKLCLVRDIVDGMSFLHSLDVMHRDLKSGNVLVNKRLVAKITDFGSMSGKLSKFQQQSAVESSTQSAAPIAETQLEYSPTSVNKTVCLTMTNGVGTPLYMAPEILDPQLRKLSLKADVFSFGVLMWEISECRVPDLLAQEIGDDFKGFVMQTLLQLYRDGKHLHFGNYDEGSEDNEKRAHGSSSSSSSPEWYQALSLLCMSFNSSGRPTFEQIKEKIESQCSKKE